MSIPDIGEKTVISIVLQLLKTISDGNHLDIRRFLRSPNAGWFSHFTTIPLTTGYHSVRIFIPHYTLFYTTTTLNKTTTLNLLNKNAAFEILFIQSPVNVIFMMEEMGSCMAGKELKMLKCKCGHYLEFKYYT